ncbi:MAG: sensor histidine kinase, partial [Saprospiraceae bacterium]
KQLPIALNIINAYIARGIFLTFPVLIVIATLVSYSRTKEKEKLLFLLGFTFFMIGFFLHFSSVTHLFEVSFWTKYGAAVGWILDIIILMVVFSNQIKQTFFKNIQLKEELSETKISAANALLEGHLEERKRLSLELHDGISIKMALLKMQLNRFFKKKGNEETAIITEVDTIAEDIRVFTHAISPIKLEEETLEDAIEDLIYKIENQTNLEIDLEMEDFDDQVLANNQKHGLFQTLQELLNNTIKYASATNVLINIYLEDENIHLHFQDNGQGFDINTVKKGIGLNNIQARADLLNGNFEVDSDENGSHFRFSFEI